MHQRHQSLTTAVRLAAGSGTPALDLEIELLESIIQYLGDLFNLCIFEFHALNIFIFIFVYKNFFVVNDFVTINDKV